MPSLGLTNTRTGGTEKNKDHMKLLFELYEAQVAHELTSEVDSRMKCVTKLAMPGTRTTVADL